MDQHVYAKTYGDILRAIGAQLDEQHYHDIFLAEVADGFVGRATRDGPDVLLEGLAYGFEDLSTDVTAKDDHPDQGVNYRALLGALGRELDRMGARMIVVMELSIGVLATFYPAGYHLEGCYGERYEILYKAEQLRNLPSLAAVS